MGAHFPSDVEAGHLAGTVIGAEIMQDPNWRQGYEAARLELRHALGLPANPPRVVGQVQDHDDDDH
jgi:acid phosphatase (class A)